MSCKVVCGCNSYSIGSYVIRLLRLDGVHVISQWLLKVNEGYFGTCAVDSV